MIHSVQSLAFNHSLSSRINSGLSLIEPTVGDLVAPLQARGRVDVGKMAMVSGTNLQRCIRNCRLGRLAGYWHTPGVEARFADGEPGKHESAGIEQAGLKSVDWIPCNPATYNLGY